MLVDLTQLGLSGNETEWRYLSINTSSDGYNRLSAIARQAAERVFGSGNDFVQNMQMLHDARITDTKLYMLNPAYVLQHAAQGPIGRGSWLYFCDYNSDFSANDWGIINLDRLRGVRR